MNKINLHRNAIGTLLLSSLAFASCSDLDEYFETPDWIGGSIYATLTDEGNYSIFLQGVDIAGYKPIMDGKSILTVMAPDDAAMSSYLTANYGTADITKVDPAEVKKLIGFHILYYSFDKQKLINFRPTEGDGATEEQQNVLAGMYYKYRSHSQDGLSTAFDRTRNRNITIYHNERMLPVFSYRMFETKGINAKENYEYFYPDTEWKGDGGFNVANAAVEEYEKVGRNGYIYKVDRVLKPLETIYQELKRAGKYERILSLYDNSEVYEYDSIQTRELASSDSLFHHYHKSPLVNIDSEWGAAMNYSQVSLLALQAYTIFAPTDEAFSNFFNEYWGEGGYESIEEIDSVTMQEIMKNCVYPSSIAFPGEVKQGKIENVSGEVINLNTDEVLPADRIVCSNGVLYGCSVLTPPTKFRAVTGPAFQYKSFTNFSQMLNNSGLSSTLVADAVRFVMLYADNDQLYNNAGIEREGATLISTASPKGMNSSTQTAYINAHVAMPVDGNTVLPATGTAVLPALTSDFKMYWYVKDGKITNSVLHSRSLMYGSNPYTEDDIWAPFQPLEYRGDANGWTNGHAYKYDNLLLPGNYADELNSRAVRLMVNNRTETTTDFYGWINLLNKAGVLNTSGGQVSFMGESCMMLVPLTDVVQTAIKQGKVPGVSVDAAVEVGSETFFDAVEVDDEQKDALTEYLKLYFVPITTAPFSNYPYLGWGENTPGYGGLPTLQQEIVGPDIVSTNMNVYDTGTGMEAAIVDRATGLEGQRVSFSGKYDFFPLVFEDGPVYFINGMF